LAAEHVWIYRDYRQQWHRVRTEHPELALFRDEKAPIPPADYLAGEISAGRALYWLADGALLIAATVVIVAIGRHRWKPPST
jgi:hypothetical protein